MSATARAPRLRAIGEVIAELKHEFPDLTQSKVRFLEGEGLIQPLRTPSGYRKFSDDDITRLRFILTLQRDNYLPLRVIKERVAQLDREEIARRLPQTHPTGGGAEVRALRPEPATDGPVHSVGVGARGIEASCSRAELIENTGLTSDQVSALEEFELIRRQPSGRFGSESILVATVAAQLAAHGFEPRHLRFLRHSANRELGVIEGAVAPLGRPGSVEAVSRRQEVVTELAEAFLVVHRALVQDGLRSL